ncbi:MAG: noncanonical pyrimidine nucleotidase, YjjG family [Clostridium sp. SCN 57-10]|nr:MAG: noncanonical pyrimidine nucleotidase, YjjG family [Clostridium sp. SCN 57-10]
MRYDTILLDSDQTLLDFAADERAALCATLRLFGAPDDDVHCALYHGINESLWRQFERGEVTKPELLERRFALFAREVGINAEPAALNASFLEHLCALGGRVLPGARELCLKLCETHKLYVVTNGAARPARTRLANAGLAHLFSHIFVSEELGTQKPEPVFFDRVFAALGDPPRTRAVLLGDSLTSDMAGAKAAGIAGCWLCPDRRHPDAEGAYDWRIAEPEEFLPIVWGGDA